MGNKITKLRGIFKPVKPDNDSSSYSSYEYVDTIHDANFSWLEGRRVSAQDFYPLKRHIETSDHVAISLHEVFKYILKGNSKVPLTSGIKRCLHIGSGHYIWLLEMADEYKEIQFEGFDVAPMYESNLKLKDPLPSNLKFTHGNIFDGGLPYPDETFDYVNVRYFLTWLPSDKITFAIKEIQRVTKRGGWVEILEMDAHIKNATPYYEDILGKIWKDICIYKCYDPKNIINLKERLENDFFEIKTSKLSIPIGRYGGRVGELYANIFIDGTNALVGIMKEKLNMTHDEIQTYLQKCVDSFDLNQAYNNYYLVCAKRKFS